MMLSSIPQSSCFFLGATTLGSRFFPFYEDWLVVFSQFVTSKTAEFLPLFLVKARFFFFFLPPCFFDARAVLREIVPIRLAHFRSIETSIFSPWLDRRAPPSPSLTFLAWPEFASPARTI